MLIGGGWAQRGPVLLAGGAAHMCVWAPPGQLVFGSLLDQALGGVFILAGCLSPS